MDAAQLYPIAFGVAAAFALVQTARLGWRERASRWRLARRVRRAAAGERDAERLLARAGYAVAERQVAAQLTYALDGAAVAVTVRADLIVTRGGRAFVAEVKTGDAAPRLRTPATRRQLLEYAHAFDVDGVLLVEPEAGRVRRVDVPRAPATPSSPSALRTLLALAIGAAAGAAAMATWLAGT